MKTLPRLFPFAALFFTELPLPARATTFTWDGGLSHGNFTTNDNWSTPNNWVNGAPIAAVDTVISFGLSGIRTTSIQNIGGSFQLAVLNFDSTSNVTGLSGGTLDFDTGSPLSPGVLGHNSATAATVQNAIILDRGLRVGGAGSGGLTLAGNLSGSGLLQKEGSGTVLLTGNNSYLGGHRSRRWYPRLGSAGALGSSGTILFSSSFSGALQFTAANQTDYSNRFSKTNTDQKFRFDTNGQNVTFASGITNGGNTTLTKLGAGTLTLSGSAANSYSGLTSVLAGTLHLNKSFATLAMGGDLLSATRGRPRRECTSARHRHFRHRRSA